MIPQRYIVQCPRCGSGVELELCAWQMSVAHTPSDEEGEGGGQGIAIEMTAFGGHACDEETA